MNPHEYNIIELCGFLAKKFISVWIEPLGFTIVILLTGIVTMSVKPLRRRGMFLVAVGTALLVISSIPITAGFLTKSLEERAGNYCDPEVLRDRGVRYIIVLAGSSVPDGFTPADRWGRPSILRVLEGVRLWRGVPESHLLLSGGSGPSVTSSPQAMAELPYYLGVPGDALHLETRSWDTAEEARLLLEIVGSQHFALVTDAIHMPRSMRIFKDLGTDPIPCPCAFSRRGDVPFYAVVLPNAGSLRDTSLAIHEYLGILWAKIRR